MANSSDPLNCGECFEEAFTQRNSFVGDFSHVLALVARDLEFVLARLARAIRARNGGGAVGRAPGDRRPCA